MCPKKDVLDAQELLKHKDFGLICLLKEFLNIDENISKYKSEIGCFPMSENILYLSYFWGGIGSIPTYKFNLCLKEISSERKCLFELGFSKNNLSTFNNKDVERYEKSKISQITSLTKLPVAGEKMFVIGIYSATGLRDLLREIFKKCNLNAPDVADVSSSDFITLTKAKNIIKTLF